MRSALRRGQGQRGALLLSLIVGMVVAGLLGAGMIYFTTTSTYGELFANRQARAYYVAEAGGRLAIKLLNENKSSTTYLPPNGTYKLGVNGSDGEFEMSSTSDNTDPDMPRVKVISTGIVHRGTWLETRKKITFKIPRSNPTAALDGTTDIFFNNGLNNVSTDPTWGFAEGPNAALKFDNGELLIQSDTKELFTVLAVKPQAIDLVTARANSGGLLSYEVQVKINMNFKDDKADYIAMGLNFRLDKALNRSYGISFYRAITDENQLPKPPKYDWFTDRFKPSFTSAPPRDGQYYIVLWVQNETDKYTLIDYALLDSSITGGFATKRYNTILLNLREECDSPPGSATGCTTTRHNLIQVYLANSSAASQYPKGTINWSYATNTAVFKRVKWKLSNLEIINDSTLTTQDWNSAWVPYSSSVPSEVGLHAFYFISANMEEFFTDFAMRGEGLGGSGGYQY